MAIGALSWRVLVHHDLLVGHHPGRFVALVAGHIGMPTGKRKVSLGVVVKSRGLPARGRMAVGTVRGIVFGQKLSVVYVLVAVFAFLRGALEARFGWRSGFVTICARDGSVRAEQWEFGLPMVESVDVAPGFRAMTSFASERCAVRAFS